MIVVGGGIIGSSIAYHLAHAGVNDVLLVERNVLTSGTTWHAAGLIGGARGTAVETKLSVDGIELVQSLEAETGCATGYKQCGSTTVARGPERLTALRRTSRDQARIIASLTSENQQQQQQQQQKQQQQQHWS